MPLLTLSYLLTIIFGLIALISTILWIKQEHNASQQNDRDWSNTYLNNLYGRSRDVLLDAFRKSDQILAESEKERGEILSKYIHSISESTKSYQEKYNTLFDQTKTKLSSDISVLTDDFANYLNNLKTTTNELQTLATTSIQDKINNLIEKFEQDLTDFFAKTERQSIQSIELEIKSARQLIDSYKQQQMMLIDDNVVAILERTLSLVLTKKLSLRDQMDLINEALEQAKVEKFIT